MIDRRSLMLGGLLLPALDVVAGVGAAAAAPADESTRFDAGMVRTLARNLASAPYKAGDKALPGELDKLSYDDYRNIRFNAERAIWRGEGLPFEMQLLHRGFLFRDRVDIHLVADGKATRLRYDPAFFRFEHGVKPPQASAGQANADLGFSGFRVHGPLNRPDVFDEIAVFQGASYFRAVGKGQVYGSSARGLAVRTAHPSGEEFPIFKAFWIETPRPGVPSVVMHGLLDSPSAAAALRFTLRPGETTVMTVEMALYPREDIAESGLGPQTSMFLFDPGDRSGFDDFRPAVRDAQGLGIIDGRGEYLWRPLANPSRLQISEFGGTNVRGFGLMQRQRSFFDYQDLEARYERRPSLWVEPIGDWGEGVVQLVEIPTDQEIHDNIVAFWRPKDPLRKGGEYNYTYRLHWTWDMPTPASLAHFSDMRVGGDSGRRLMVLDVVDGPLRDVKLEDVEARVSAGTGSIANVVLQPNPDISGARLSFLFDPKGAELSELRAGLFAGGTPISETWLYRWTA